MLGFGCVSNTTPALCTEIVSNIPLTEPVSVEITSEYNEAIEDRIIGMALSQTTITQEHVDHAIKMRDGIKLSPSNQLSISESALQVGSVLNACLAIYEDLEMLRIGWISNGKYETLSEEVVKPELIDDRMRKVIKYQRLLKNLALCCVGYINCENIYLEKEGEVPEAVNRKRESKGKSRLEPYYVCRIKGVQYDSHATGTGVKHGIRYDVRGHFRRLDSGKTIWVRPHQRGLQNELYIPKVYNVAKDSKPGWKPDKEKGD